MSDRGGHSSARAGTRSEGPGLESGAFMGLRERPGRGAGTWCRGTGEPWEVCEQGRGSVKAKCGKTPLGPCEEVKRGQEKLEWGSSRREGGLTGAG